MLLNISLLKLVQMHKGFKHGDFFPPYLIIMIGEVLMCLFNKAKELGYMEALDIGINRVFLKYSNLLKTPCYFCQKTV